VLIAGEEMCLSCEGCVDWRVTKLIQQSVESNRASDWDAVFRTWHKRCI